jgi:ABC-type multidrug transport system ATPase subunit
MKLYLVCPKCSYGFEAEHASRYNCPNPDCGHVFKPQSSTMYMAITTEGRTALPELRVISGENEGQIFPLTKTSTIIGRDESCDVRFSTLTVSNRHADIVRIMDKYIINDLGSRAGVIVNGKRVKSSELSMGDRIILSGIELEFRIKYRAKSIEDSAQLRKYSQEYTIFLKQNGESTDRIVLDKQQITIGRSSDRDVFIDHPLVSRKHALLFRDDKGWIIMDTKSVHGTFVNGKGIINIRLANGDLLQLGPLLFQMNGDELIQAEAAGGIELRADNVSVYIGNENYLIREISFKINPGEIIGLLGPSGAGKTTLLNALCGFRQPSSGAVFFNDRNLALEFGLFRSSTGYVPQDDIIHKELDPWYALYYAGKLRLPRDTSDDELHKLVGETLETLGLSDRIHVQISRISGGQIKRVNVGVELLTKCKILFMDEPTSGLDPFNEARLMKLFRKLADQGRTIILTTHIMENVDLLDKIAVLYGGRLIYFGKAEGAKKYFSIKRATDLYEKLEEKKPDAWEEEFRNSEEHGQCVRKPTDQIEALSEIDARERQKKSKIGTGDLLRQFSVMTKRYAHICINDPKNMFMMVAQPLIIFSGICLVFDRAWQVLFLSALAIFWLGCTNAAREIIKEQSIYLRERMVNMGIIPYVFSKAVVLSVVCLFQTLINLFYIKIIEGIDGDIFLYFLSLFLASLSGLSTGLAISASVKTEERAIALVPIFLIPQIIFAGMIEEVSNMNAVSSAISYIISTRWTYESLQFIFQERNAGTVWINMLIVLIFPFVLLSSSIIWLRTRERFGKK